MPFISDTAPLRTIHVCSRTRTQRSTYSAGRRAASELEQLLSLMAHLPAGCPASDDDGLCVDRGEFVGIFCLTLPRSAAPSALFLHKGYFCPQYHCGCTQGQVYTEKEPSVCKCQCLSCADSLSLGGFGAVPVALSRRFSLPTFFFSTTKAHGPSRTI